MMQCPTCSTPLVRDGSIYTCSSCSQRFVLRKVVRPYVKPPANPERDQIRQLGGQRFEN